MCLIPETKTRIESAPVADKKGRKEKMKNTLLLALAVCLPQFSQAVITLDQYGGIPNNDSLMATIWNSMALTDALYAADRSTGDG